MTPAELQTLFDRLGPEWRVFVRTTDPEEVPAYEWLATKITVMDTVRPGWFTIGFGEITGTNPIYMDIKEPEVLASSNDGHLLTAERRDPDDLTVAEFSTVTLTPAMLRMARR